jgi:DNA-binding transcriptional ArsR family regulator
MSDIDRILSAITDPTRRRVLESLRFGPRTVRDIAEGQPVSRPAVSQHLRVLGEARLVKFDRVGRQNYYSLDHSGLSELRSYVDTFWTDVLEAFHAAALVEKAKGRKPN